jgi:hypothetical protein
LGAPPAVFTAFADTASTYQWLVALAPSPTFFFFFCSAGAWIQGLHLDPLHQPYFCDGLFWDRVSRAICLGWLQTEILLISASWVARITGMRHPCSASHIIFRDWMWQ